MASSSSSHAVPMEVDDELLQALSRPNRTTDIAVGWVFSTEMTKHFCATGYHDERPERIIEIYRTLAHARLIPRMEALPIREATEQEILLVHTMSHWKKILGYRDLTDQATVDSNLYFADELSVYVMSATTHASLLSCGGAIEACVAVASPQSNIQRSFANIRPPGHHAVPDEHMGFCFFCNAAVAARVVQQTTPVKRILIVDWDIHHGNGTQTAFYDDPSVLYISLHRYEDGTFYPTGDFGAATSCGEDAGLGFSVNIPWDWDEEGKTDYDYIYAFRKIVMPIAVEFDPELVIISSGFDAAEGDPLGECHVTPAGYAHMTYMLCALAGGHVAGGYDLEAIAKSSQAVVQVLLGEMPPALPAGGPSAETVETIYEVSLVQEKYWRSIRSADVMPVDSPTRMKQEVPSNILQWHRQYYMRDIHKLTHQPVELPVLDPFRGLVLANATFMTAKTLIVFVHGFGDLREDWDAAPRQDLQGQLDDILQASDNVMRWVNDAGYGYMDVNVLAWNSELGHTRMTKLQSPEENAKKLLIHLWDNLLTPCAAHNIVLLGHGSGCYPIVKSLTARWNRTSTRVRAVIQVVGHEHQPEVPDQGEQIVHKWYSDRSLLVVPTMHRCLLSSANEVYLRRHGQVSEIDEVQPVRLLRRGLSVVRDFLEIQL
ncbi:Arginase/deacetylase [Cylindrobasidium torrendii FP15055 ss-10]|uniref:histone deacetylase n=1 Tax=Cylindrobasidium torrendii FP15055 ss-10 TaxID=1314674 RepID=A0A0D7BC59_9AGAR|nr:Arginase/deacetylase [Cylindrobasidium torrendii FP15055 ss-10]